MKAKRTSKLKRAGEERAKARSQQRMVSRLRRRYTRVVKMGDKWNTYLQIDHQGFCVVEQTCRQRAQWVGKMLAVALERMLAANAKAQPAPALTSTNSNDD